MGASNPTNITHHSTREPWKMSEHSMSIDKGDQHDDQHFQA
jgi:hypothetical protein